MTLSEWILQVDNSKLELIKKYDKGIEIVQDITSLSFIDIKRNIPELISDGKFDEAISIISGNSISNTLKIEPLKRFRMLIWIEKQYEKINQIEKRYLERPPDFKMLSAGIKQLDVLGITNVIDMLAGGDVTKWDDIEQLPYSKCFDKQLKLIIENDINKKLVEQNKNERKNKR